MSANSSFLETTIFLLDMRKNHSVVPQNGLLFMFLSQEKCL